MSRDGLDRREEVLAEFAREVRRFNGLGASFFRAAAGRIKMNVTDLQVIDLLDLSGPATAGQLAEVMGLTTGAITGMIDRLEKAGLVRGERDPEDGRRVIVRLTTSADAMRDLAPIYDSIERGWDQVAAQYDDAQLAFLVDFLKHGNAMSQAEIARLREATEGEGADSSAPLSAAQTPHALFFSGVTRLTLSSADAISDLYRAHFTGTAPNVKVEPGRVTIRYPQRLWSANWWQRAAEVTLNATVPWQIVIRGSAASVIAELGAVNLTGLEVSGGMSMVRLQLPAPVGATPVLLSGSTSDVTIRRPAGIPVRVHLKGWVTTLVLDDQSHDGMGSDVRLQTPDYDHATRRYDIEVAGSASVIRITTL
jgi:DNA-binding MarR family transcriptional regulator